MSALLDLLFPPLCINCRQRRRARFGLCAACLAQVEMTGLLGCIRCGRICQGRECAPLDHRYSRVLSLAAYRGPWRLAVQKVKFGNDKSLARELVQELAILAAAAGFALPQAIIPVPGAVKSWRNFDIIELACRQLTKTTGAPTLRALGRRPGRLPQVKLNRRQRLEGLEDYIYVQEGTDFAGAVIWLVDDVFTTGATADACAGALMSAGARSVYVLVLAA